MGKVKKTETCWLWTASTTHKGYGQFQVGTFKSPKIRQAHRVSYEIYKGEIPQGYHILHSCDNRICVNPEHLRVGTNTDNTIDRILRNPRYWRAKEKYLGVGAVVAE